MLIHKVGTVKKNDMKFVNSKKKFSKMSLSQQYVEV
jgi:hypothetical protein